MKSGLFKYMNALHYVILIAVGFAACAPKTMGVSNIPDVKNINNMGLPLVISVDKVYNSKQQLPEIQQPIKERIIIKQVAPDSTILKMTAIISKQSDEINLYHDRQITISDRNYKVKNADDSIIRLLRADTSRKAALIKTIQAEKDIQATQTYNQALIVKYFPLWMGVAMLVGGVLSMIFKKEFDKSSGNSYKQPTL